MIGKKAKDREDIFSFDNGDIKALLSEGLKIEGNITSKEKIRIDGEIRGDIVGEYVILGKTARVFGNIKVKTLIVQGFVDGSITANNVEVKSGAEISGDINTDNLSAEYGTSIKGMVVCGKFHSTELAESASISSTETVE